MICSFPEIDFVPDQLPEAIHESALDDVQLRVVDCPTSTSELFVESETEIDKTGSGAEFPPRLLHSLREEKVKMKLRIVYFSLKLIFQF